MSNISRDKKYSGTEGGCPFNHAKIVLRACEAR